jgi:hypothetical protein
LASLNGLFGLLPIPDIDQQALIQIMDGLMKKVKFNDMMVSG